MMGIVWVVLGGIWMLRYLFENDDEIKEVLYFITAVLCFVLAAILSW